MRKMPAILLALVLCPVPARAANHSPDAVTFAEHIAPLVFTNCATCHRPGQAAPFSLLTYADARKHAKTMLRVMQDRYMPPWQPEPGHGSFRGERRLSDSQINLFEKWVKAGMVEGDPKKLPPLPKFPEGWQLGQPDLVVKMDRPFDFPAEGSDVYQNFVLPLGLTEDKWVTAVEFRASAPEVVHHVLYFLDDSGRARARAPKDGQPGFPGMAFRRTGSLGGWAVGATPVRLPDGLALPLRKKSDLVLQTHFHAAGKAVKELLTVGLYFADKPPRRTLVNLPLPPAFGLFSNIDIPAGRADFKVSDAFTLPVDVDLVGVGAHAHYLGKTMKAAATLSSGVMELFSIRDWDFNWQGQYLYKDYVRLPKGTVIHADVTWDNSAGNPRNPSDPPVRVRWGEATTDEMGQVNFLMVAADETNTGQLRQAIQAHLRQTAIRSRLRGDTIDWEKLGVEAPLFRKGAPLVPQKKQPEDPPLSFRDLDGKQQTPLTVDGAKANVLFFLTTDCPISNSYAPEINALVKDYTHQPVRFYAVHVDPELTADAARRHAKEYGLTLPIIIDAKHQLVTATGVLRTPEVAVLLHDGTLAYRGRIDDRYPSLGKKRQTPGQRDLRDALSAILAGESVRVPRTEAIGCSIPDLMQE
jgi:thiol-disulfide isomerase/thioredoxin/mono/diheme cytochrome c family protein